MATRIAYMGRGPRRSVVQRETHRQALSGVDRRTILRRGGRSTPDQADSAFGRRRTIPPLLSRIWAEGNCLPVSSQSRQSIPAIPILTESLAASRGVGKEFSLYPKIP